MHFAIIALGCCLVAQQSTEADPFRPRVVPSRRPAAVIDPDASAVEEAQPVAAPDSANDGVLGNRGPSAGDGLAAPDGAAGTASQPESQLAPVGDVPRQRLRPPELLAEALATPREGALDGMPVELLEALSHTPDRQQQLKIVQA